MGPALLYSFMTCAHILRNGMGDKCELLASEWERWNLARIVIDFQVIETTEMERRQGLEGDRLQPVIML